MVGKCFLETMQFSENEKHISKKKVHHRSIFNFFIYYRKQKLIFLFLLFKFKYFIFLYFWGFQKIYDYGEFSVTRKENCLFLLERKRKKIFESYVTCTFNTFTSLDMS
jgi:hypothetical protein